MSENVTPVSALGFAAAFVSVTVSTLSIPVLTFGGVNDFAMPGGPNTTAVTAALEAANEVVDRVWPL